SLDVAGHAGLEETLEREGPAVVVLATPPSGREALVLAAAAADGVRAIVIEKPFALSLPSAERMLAACAARGVLLVVGHQLSFVPSFAGLQRAVAAGELGEPELLRSSGHGGLLDQGPHLVDALLRLAGGRAVRWVMSQRGDAAAARLPEGARAGSGDEPAPAWMTHYLAFDDGLRAVLETGPLHQRGRGFVDEWLDKRVTVVGSRGVGEAQAAGPCRLLREGAPWDVRVRGGLDDYLAATPALHAAVRDAVLDGTPHPSDARGALAGLEVLMACAQSAVDGDAAVLPLARDRDPLAELAAARQVPRRAAGGAPEAPTGRSGPDVAVILALPDHR